MNMHCKTHSDNRITAVCVTCRNTLVCVECMTDGSHDCHDFRKPQEIANNIKMKLVSKEAEDCKHISRLESDLKNAHDLQTQQDDGQNDTTTLINKQKEEIIAATNKMTEDFLSDNKAKFLCNRVKLQEADDEISTKLERVRKHREEIKRLIDEKDAIKVVYHFQNVEDIQEYNTSFPKLDTITFTPGKISKTKLKLMFGITTAETEEMASLQRAQVVHSMVNSTESDFEFPLNHPGRVHVCVLESTFKYSKANAITELCSGYGGKAWVSCKNAKELSLTDKHGRVEKTVKLNNAVKCATALSETTLLVCTESRDITQVTVLTGGIMSMFAKSTITVLFSLKKLYPLCIYPSPDGDIYATLVDATSYDVTTESERVLVRYSQQGQDKARAQYNKHGDVLFVRPFKVLCNANGDAIGVLNDMDQVNGHLVLLNADLTLRLRFLGNGTVIPGEEKFDTTVYKPDTNFAISDFTFDPLDNIIICEVYSRSVKLLSKDCVPMVTILPEQEHSPTSIMLTANEMWLGFYDGTVNVYKYK